MEIKTDYKTMFCRCGCGNGVVLKVTRYSEECDISLQLVSDNFYKSVDNSLNNLREKLKRIWCVIMNKEHCYFDILLDTKEIQEFKSFVEKL